MLGNEEREAAFHRANMLLGQGRFEEAISALSEARDAALKAGDKETGAFYSSVLGAFLASRGFVEEALDACLTAEVSDPEQPSWQVSTANHLLALGRAEEARAKALEVLANAREMAVYEHAGFSLLGLAELALGNTMAAVEAFTASTDPSRVSLLPGSSRDLRLAVGLLSAGTIAETCRAYIRDVKVRAQADGDSNLEVQISQIESRFTT